jgi:mannose-6-phosphate isomerase
VLALQPDQFQSSLINRAIGSLDSVTLKKIGNQPMRYLWGSKDLIPDLLGIEPDGQPMAELWFGTHPNSPAVVLDDQSGSLLDRFGELPFLVKFLASAEPLSIQAHPSKQRAEKMFGQHHPSYQDANHKPELLVALTEFRALCGFRSPEDLLPDLELLAQASVQLEPLLEAYQTAGIEKAVNWIYEADQTAVLQLVAHAPRLSRKRARLIEELHAKYPADPGILVSLLMNLVTLMPGQALFVPAGTIHAYLSGLGVEVMANSDNVLRGGLTSKAVDSKELLRVLDFSTVGAEVLEPRQLLTGLEEYPVPVSDFTVYRLRPSSQSMLVDLELKGRAVLVCVEGELSISTSLDPALSLKKGEAAYLADARLFSVAGSGLGYLSIG